jgi:Ca2+-binding RTX toxin-like protein
MIGVMLLLRCPVHHHVSKRKENIMAIHQKRDPETGQIIIEGDEEKDNIHVKRRMVEGHEDGVVVEDLDRFGHVTQSYTLNAQEVKQGGGLAIDGGKGDDYIHVDDNVHADLGLYGGEGDDTIMGGAGNDLIIGGEGNDTIHGGAGKDYIMGNEGDDKLYGDTGQDTLITDAYDSVVDPGNDKGDKSFFE